MGDSGEAKRGGDANRTVNHNQTSTCTFEHKEELLRRSESEPSWLSKLDISRQLEGGATFVSLQTHTHTQKKSTPNESTLSLKCLVDLLWQFQLAQAGPDEDNKKNILLSVALN